MDPVAPADAERLLRGVHERCFETYIHFPFCETSCTFCHFHKEVRASISESTQRSLVQAVIAEIRLHAQVLGKLRARSLYIGGGTPSIMSNQVLRELLATVHRYVTIENGAELKFEFYPRAYAPKEIADKLGILRDFGFTDIVIDLESGSDAALRSVGRGNSSIEHYRRLIEACGDHGFDSVVTGLIIGLPGETFSSLAATLDELIATPLVKVINTFPLITRPPDAIFSQMTRSPHLFQDALGRDALWVFARSRLREAGFIEGPISYHRRPGKHAQQQEDKFECVNLLGFGPSGFGYLNGQTWAAQYFNYCTNDDYYRRVRGGDLAMWRAGILDMPERARRKLIFGLANCKPEPLSAIERRFGVSITDIVGRELNALSSLGLIHLDPEQQTVKYTDDGLCRLEEISYFLGSSFVKDRCAAPVPTHERVQLMRHHYYIDVAPDDRRLFEAYTRSQAPTIEYRSSGKGYIMSNLKDEEYASS